MTYLEAVNSVLVRMREDTVLTLAGSDDVVVDLVKQFVKDAVELVSQAHTWSALADTWAVTTASGTKVATLTGGATLSVVNAVFNSQGTELTNMTRTELTRRGIQSPENNNPRHYAINGKVSGEVTLLLWPTPQATEALVVTGNAEHPELSVDGTEILVPAKTVVHYALALAARERGEVGAQSVPELLGLASQSLSDSIALDSANTPSDNIWTSV